MGRVYLTPSLVSTQSWCEWQIYLEKVKGQKRKFRQVVKEGTKVHQALEEQHKKEAEEMTLARFLEEGGITRELYLICEKHGISGKIDEIILTDDKVIIIDDKKTPKPYDGYKHQLYAYALLVDEELVPRRPIYVALRDSETQEVTWIQEYKEDHKEKLLNLMERIRNIIKEETEPIPTESQKTCSYCSLDCPKRLAPYIDWSDEMKEEWKGSQD